MAGCAKKCDGRGFDVWAEDIKGRAIIRRSLVGDRTHMKEHAITELLTVYRGFRKENRGQGDG